jgi:hypothetical protein
MFIRAPHSGGQDVRAPKLNPACLTRLAATRKLGWNLPIGIGYSCFDRNC